MDGLEISPPYGLGGGDSMVDLYKRVAKGAQDQQKQEIDLVKGSVASLINSYNTTQSTPLREQIVSTMKSYVSYLPAPLAKEIEPYIANGPISPLEEKRREFLKYNPPPQEPELDTGDAKVVLPIYEHKWAEYAFQASEHKRALNSFLYGSDAAGEKLTFMPISETRAALRSKEGQVMILNNTDLKINEMAAKYKVDPKEIYLTGGILPIPGSETMMNINGRRITSQGLRNIWDPDPNTNTGSKVTSEQAIPKSAYDIEHPPALVKFALDWKAPSPKDPAIAELKKRSMKKKNWPIVQRELEGLYSTYSFRIVETEKIGFWKKVVDYIPFFVSYNTEEDAANTALIFIKGKPIPLPDSTGVLLTYYYDESSDLVSDNLGIPRGNLQSAAAFVASTVKGQPIVVKE